MKSKCSQLCKTSGAVGFSVSSQCDPYFDVSLDVCVQIKQKYINEQAYLFSFGENQDALLLVIKGV